MGAAFSWQLRRPAAKCLFDTMPHNVAYFLAEQAAQHPHAAAVRAPVGRETNGAIRYVERSFSQLDTEASATAHYFAARGITRGTRVLLMVKP